MKSRQTIRGRRVGRGTVGLLAAVVLLPVLLALGASTAQAAQPSASAGSIVRTAATFCLPGPSTACIAGTLRADDVLPDVTLKIKAPDGTETEVTTDESGKWNLQVDTEGTYVVTIDESTLPKDLTTTGTVTVDAKFAVTSPALITIRSADYSDSTSKIDELLQSSVSGIRLGLLLALASVGLSLIYGTTGLSNFAHAEQVTLGGMVGYMLVNNFGLPLLVGGVLVVVLCGFTGWLQDVVLWKPLRRRGLGITQLMIVTIGLSLALQYAFQYSVGSRTVRVVRDNPQVQNFGPITITTQSLVAMAIAALVLGGVGYALLRTRIGRATRAVSDNPALAQASGIDTDKVIRLVWTTAAALAGLSGLLYALVTNGIKWDSGLQILLLLFAATTLGGLGTAFGALVGSLVIGLVVEVSPVLGMPGDFKYATALVILILLLLVRPQGLLGKAQRIG